MIEIKPYFSCSLDVKLLYVFSLFQTRLSIHLYHPVLYYLVPVGLGSIVVQVLRLAVSVPIISFAVLAKLVPTVFSAKRRPLSPGVFPKARFFPCRGSSSGVPHNSLLLVPERSDERDHFPRQADLLFPSLHVLAFWQLFLFVRIALFHRTPVKICHSLSTPPNPICLNPQLYDESSSDISPQLSTVTPLSRLPPT